MNTRKMQKSNNKKTNKKRRIILGVVLVVLLLGLAIGAKFLIEVQNYQNQIAGMEINEVNLAYIEDGVYEGTYDASLIKVKVLVDVKNHEISNIELVQHENGKGTPAEAIIPEVIATQSLDVEAISGATNSSKVILKSIELALNGGKEMQ